MLGVRLVERRGQASLGQTYRPQRIRRTPKLEERLRQRVASVGDLHVFLPHRLDADVDCAALHHFGILELLGARVDVPQPSEQCDELGMLGAPCFVDDLNRPFATSIASACRPKCDKLLATLANGGPSRACSARGSPRKRGRLPHTGAAQLRSPRASSRHLPRSSPPSPRADVPGHAPADGPHAPASAPGSLLDASPEQPAPLLGSPSRWPRAGARAR